MSPVLLFVDELVWVDAPPSLPPGAKIAVIQAEGLKNPEPFTFRLKLPPNYKIAPHTHPAIEHVTVLSGTFYFAEGSDTEKVREYAAGSVMIMPIGHSMVGFTKDEEAVIQVHGMGPWGITYSDPADDPRNK
jgi:quercetin dioxygenase-like cupin family protein